MLVGIDFDNTIVSYDALMHTIVAGWGVISTDTPQSKKQIRDAIRRLPDGETVWQRLQAAAYGSRIHEAPPAAGVEEFFRFCRRQGIPVCIISHKTEYSNLGESRVNLRTSAMDWLKQRGLVDGNGCGIETAAVYFEPSRAAKVGRIRNLGVTHFIDDLEETFEDPAFPPGVHKMLYADTAPRDAHGILTFAAWSGIQEHFAHKTAWPVTEPPVSIELLSDALGAVVDSVERTGRGGNSRVFRVCCADGNEFAAKFYFRRPGAGRSRLDAEFNAISFMWQHGIRCIPRPVSANAEREFALYEFVAGQEIDSADVTASDLDQLVQFASELKELNARPEGRALPLASDACLSINAIFRQIEERLARLEVHAPGNDALARFLAADFTPAVARLKERTTRELGGDACGRELPAAQQTLSPSDFGFHNALRQTSGVITFLDFEYFGRDDPAKMIADFLLHPAQALSEEIKCSFVRRMVQVFKDDRGLAARLECYYPLVGLKWCMIMLNEFVPDDLARREFAARAPMDSIKKKQLQLEKSRAMFEKIMTGGACFPYRGCAA